MDVKPIDRRSLADSVFDQLAGQIIGGRLAAAEALPPERTLTEHFQVNRQAVREALQRLAQIGLVEIRHGDATRVADYTRRAGLDLLPRLLVSAEGEVDVAVVRSVMEMRAALGPDIAGRCAERAIPAAVEAVSEAFDELAGLIAVGGEPAALAAGDLAFWDALVEGSQNVAYRLAFNSLRRVYEPAIDALAPVLLAELGDVEGHRSITGAVITGDRAGAEDAAWALLARGTEAMTTVLAAGDGPS
jgi:DNA-binding FadR family transcriptional regulator